MQRTWIVAAWQKEQIKEKAYEKRVSIAQLARKYGVTPLTMYAVLSGRERSQPMLQFLEKELGIKIIGEREEDASCVAI